MKARSKDHSHACRMHPLWMKWFLEAHELAVAKLQQRNFILYIYNFFLSSLSYIYILNILHIVYNLILKILHIVYNLILNILHIVDNLTTVHNITIYYL